MRDWRFWARKSQLPPKGDWLIWLFLGGRGAGKTRAAAEWVKEMVETEKAKSIALIGQTIKDVRDVMIYGKSGLIGISDKDFMPIFESSKRMLTWPNGAVAYCYSAEVPDSLRGPQFDLAWGDEFAAWPDGDEVLDILLPALRIGDDPRMILTTTPKPVSWVKKLTEDDACVITKSSTRENMANLAKNVVANLEKRFEQSVWARQELMGELIEDAKGALWSREDIKKARKGFVPCDYDKIIIAVDPPATKGKNADACGIIVAGSFDNGQKCAILCDLTTKGQAPHEWAKIIADAYESFEANFIVAESNQGGEMVREIIKLQAKDAPVKLVHAKSSKRTRAEPVAILYSQGRVVHQSHFPELEDEMCSFGTNAKEQSRSPDRVDALVWAISHLLLENGGSPRARMI